MKNWIRKLAAFLLAALLVAALPVTAFAKDGEDETPELDERIEAALEWGLRIAEDNSHGYSKYSRFSLYSAQPHLLFSWFENSKMTENLLHISKSCRMLQGILQFYAKI